VKVHLASTVRARRWCCRRDERPSLLVSPSVDEPSRDEVPFAGDEVESEASETDEADEDSADLLLAVALLVLATAVKH
jgi:hypothetical protein